MRLLPLNRTSPCARREPEDVRNNYEHYTNYSFKRKLSFIRFRFPSITAGCLSSVYCRNTAQYHPRHSPAPAVTAWTAPPFTWPSLVQRVWTTTISSSPSAQKASTSQRIIPKSSRTSTTFFAVLTAKPLSYGKLAWFQRRRLPLTRSMTSVPERPGSGVGRPHRSTWPRCDVESCVSLF